MCRYVCHLLIDRTILFTFLIDCTHKWFILTALLWLLSSMTFVFVLRYKAPYSSPIEASIPATVQ